MLAQDVRAIAENEAAPADLRAVARQLQQRYRYPVDFQVIDHLGKLYAQAEANRRDRPYRQVLRQGLQQLPY